MLQFSHRRVSSINKQVRDILCLLIIIRGVVTIDIESKEVVSHVSMPKRYLAATPFYHFGFSRDTVAGLSLTKTHIAAFDVTQRVVDHLYLLWAHKLKFKVNSSFPELDINLWRVKR